MSNQQISAPVGTDDHVVVPELGLLLTMAEWLYANTWKMLADAPLSDMLEMSTPSISWLELLAVRSVARHFIR
jgi:hypothetical protein